jgi:hypothetical protein
MTKKIGEEIERVKSGDGFDRKWITEKAQEVLTEYAGGITLRQLHYRLVARGMINDTLHYKRVIEAMTAARWADTVSMDAFIDRERSMYGETKVEAKDLSDEISQAKNQIEAWMTGYRLNRWSNQENYVEVWIEKKALQGVFEPPCDMLGVGLAPCKGYPSITFLHEASERLDMVDSDKQKTILYFGDYDPSGEDIPNSIRDNLERMGSDVEVERIALNPDLIRELSLPSVPPKPTDSRTRNWDGNGAVELDAVEPKRLKSMCERAINKYFDTDLYHELLTTEEKERKEYQLTLKKFVQGMKV